MNDFERIYTVIKSKYSCGVPFYNYDNCTYDSLSNMYYQQGVLSLQNSTGYSNVPFNDIPVACGFPNTVYRQCVPSEPPDEEEKVELPSGFRINVNSAYVYPEEKSIPIVSATTLRSDNPGTESNIFDKNEQTFWLSDWVTWSSSRRYELRINFDNTYFIKKFLIKFVLNYCPVSIRLFNNNQEVKQFTVLNTGDFQIFSLDNEIQTDNVVIHFQMSFDVSNRPVRIVEIDFKEYSLILKNPNDFDLDISSSTGLENMYNTLYYNEKLGFNNCFKHINTKKYIGFDSRNNFILVDSCTESNNLEYDKDNFTLKRKLTDNCFNTNTFYNVVPNDTSLVLSDCNLDVDVKLELMNDFIAFYSRLRQVATTEYIMSVGTTIVPSTFSTIPTKYFSETVTYTKVRYSSVSILTIIHTSTTKRAYLTFDDGITWRQLTSSINILDGDMSADGKYITLCEDSRYYVSQNADTPSLTFRMKLIDKANYKVILSKTGQLQCLQFRNNNFISNDYGNTFKNNSIGLYDIDIGFYYFCTSYSGSISISFKHVKRTPFVLGIDFLNNIIIDIPSQNYWIEDNVPTNSINNIQKVLISEDCKYIFILDSNGLVINTSYFRPQFWKVNSLQNIKESQRILLGISIDINNVKGDMCISKNGKFVYLIYKVLKSDGTYGGLIFYSKDYGDTFQQLKTNDNFINNNLNNFTSLDVSPDGKTLVLSDTIKVYKTSLSDNEIGDDITDKNTIISIPSNEYKYLLTPLTPLSTFTKSIKNRSTIYRISEQNILVDDSNTILITVPVSLNTRNISSICKSDDNNIVLYSIGNNIYNKNSNIVFTALSPIVFLTFKNLPNNRNMYIALSDKIHYSNDGILWNTVNMISKKWVSACIVPILIQNNYVIYCIEEFGKFYFSSDNGITWKSNDILENYSWISIDCSTDGKIVIATIKNNLPLISYDGGLSFNFIKFNETLVDISGNYIKQFIDCSINENGSIISIVLDNGRIIISKDFGKSWNYYGDYYFYQNDIDLNKKDTLYTFSSSLVNTNISGYTYTNSNILNVFSKNMFTGATGATGATGSYFSYFPNQSGYSITYGQINSNNLLYTGLSTTKTSNVNILGDFIEIKYNYLFKLNNLTLGGISYDSSTFDSFVRECNILASLDGINFTLIGSTFSGKLTWYAPIIKFIVNDSNYYKVFRIVIRSVNNQSLVRSVNIFNLSFEGDIYTPTTALNTTSKWNNIVIKPDRVLAVRNNNQLLQGFKIHPIFTENDLNRVVSDVTYTPATTGSTNSHSLSSDLYVNNLTINSGYTLITNGFRIFCRGKLTNNGIINNDGIQSQTIRTLGIGANGGDGGTTSILNGSPGGNSTNCVINANGGRGGNGASGGIANTTSNVEILSLPQFAIVGRNASNNVINGGAGGGGGSRGTTINGGSGGAGGGIIMICANQIENNGIITARGQDGFSFTSTSNISSGSGAGGGGGGGGGTIIIVTTYTSTLDNTKLLVSGGKGGSGQVNTSNSSLSGLNGENGRDGRLVVVFV